MLKLFDKKLHLRSEDNRYLNSPALLWPGGEMSYREYFNQINRLTDALLKKGLRKGDRVAVISDIHFHFPLFFFAILKAGGIVVPIRIKLPKGGINQIIRETNCEWTITINQSNISTPNNSQNYYLSDDLFYQTNKNKSSVSYPDPLLENDATIIFTSGSQGRSKSVLHTIGNHYYSAKGSNANISLGRGDRWLVRLPFCHIAGIAILFRCLLSGACCVLPESNQTDTSLIKKYKITHISMVPVQLQRLIASHSLSEITGLLKSILLGGDKIPESLIKKTQKLNLPVNSSYGSTEMCSQIATTSGDQIDANVSVSGKVLRFRELKIGSGGGILVRGKTLCRGYVEGKQIKKITDDEGWFNTGDLGYFDEKDNLIIRGRADNMFISGGENIHPEEIEREILKQDKVMDACVVDIPDEEFGARPVAFIKLSNEEEIDQKQIKSSLEKRLPRYKIPVHFLPLPEKSRGFKFNRTELRKIALENWSTNSTN